MSELLGAPVLPAAAGAPAGLRHHGAEGDCVLVVAHQPEAFAPLHDALNESGYTVLLASGASALAQAVRTRPDIVLLDAPLPGLEVVRQLKSDARSAHIPIVVIADQGDADQPVAALEAGAVDCVARPLKARELLARMQVHLRGARRARQAAQQAGQARHALDAFGYASFTVRMPQGRLTWQTPLSRELLQRHAGTPAGELPPAVLAWLQSHLPAARRGVEPPPLALGADPDAAAGTRLELRLHRQIGDAEQGEDVEASDDWLIIMRERSGMGMVEAMRVALQLTPREAEVLYWVVKGKTNRDIGEILGSSPATAKKHLERIYVKLGVETRTAAAGAALKRIRELQPGFEA